MDIYWRLFGRQILWAMPASEMGSPWLGVLQNLRKGGLTMGVYKRGDVYYINYFLNGKRVRKRVGKSKKDADKELTAVQGKIDGRTFVPPRKDSFDKLLDDYEEGQREKKTYKSEQYVIGRIREYFAGAVVQEIGVERVMAFLAHLKALPVRGGKKRGSADINHHMVCLCSILERAVKLEWIARNPAGADKVDRPPKAEPRKKYLTVEDAGRLLNACPPYLYSIVLCALDTGMRKSEVLGLRWSEIKDGMIHLPAGRTKTNTARKVPVSETLGAELERIKAAHRGNKRLAVFDLVFQPPRERKIRRRGEITLLTGPMKDVRGSWAAAKRDAGIDPDLTIHDLRRTWRTHMKTTRTEGGVIRPGIDSYTLNEIDGHANPKIEKTYTPELSDEHLKWAISHVPKWQEAARSHKTATTSEGKKKGLRAVSTQPLDFPGAEEGS
jgi:integrase